MLYTIQWRKPSATGEFTSEIVNAKLVVPVGTSYQCSVGARFWPLRSCPAGAARYFRASVSVKASIAIWYISKARAEPA